MNQTSARKKLCYIQFCFCSYEILWHVGRRHETEFPKWSDKIIDSRGIFVDLYSMDEVDRIWYKQAWEIFNSYRNSNSHYKGKTVPLIFIIRILHATRWLKCQKTSLYYLYEKGGFIWSCHKREAVGIGFLTDLQHERIPAISHSC